ncbi:BnaA02g19240D [Brassica napus]|uniref:BnaA02g19240D protein n=3 Tax=Brassica TaxID=3705 RepID=A0A078IKY9_BRANA|nr:BnaA02g19240D [Brassica napus]
MLRHLKLNKQAEQIHSAIINTIAEGKYRTADLGGTSTTTEFTKAICNHL